MEVFSTGLSTFLLQEDFMRVTYREALAEVQSHPNKVCTFFCSRAKSPHITRESDAIVAFYNDSDTTQTFRLRIGDYDEVLTAPSKSVVYPFQGLYPIVLLSLGLEAIQVEGDMDSLYVIHCYLHDREQRLMWSSKEHVIKLDSTYYKMCGLLQKV